MHLSYLLLLSLPLANSKDQWYGLLEEYQPFLRKIAPDRWELANQDIPHLVGACVTNRDTPISELILRNINTRRIESGAIIGPKSLKVLVIRDNAIKQLPASPFKLANLETLIFTNNQVEELDVKAFAGLPKLYKLDLSRNRLKVLHREVLQPIPNLHNIDLNRNAIKFVKGGTFMYLNKFPDNIALNENGLTNIDTHALPQDARIENLTLAGNKLSDISFE